VNRGFQKSSEHRSRRVEADIVERCGSARHEPLVTFVGQGVTKAKYYRHEDPALHRTAHQQPAQIANSVKCAALRINRFAIIKEDSDIAGNNHLGNCAIIAAVLKAEKVEVENAEMPAAQSRSEPNR